MKNLDIVIRKMNIKDVHGLMDLKNSVGWNHKEEDWLRLMKLEPNGCFVAVKKSNKKEKIIGSITTTSYGKKLGWIGMIIVYEEFRHMGIGFELMTKGIDYLKSKNIRLIKLDASELGKPLYLKNGFKEEDKTINFHLILSEYQQIKEEQQFSSLIIENIFESNTKTIDEIKINSVIKYDQNKTKIDRSNLLSNFITEFPDLVYIARNRSLDDDKITGYIIGHQKSHFTEIGPLLADDILTATSLLNNFVLNCSDKDKSIMIGTFERKKEFTQILVDMGFHLSGFNTRMYLGNLTDNPDNSLQWAISGAAKG